MDGAADAAVPDMAAWSADVFAGRSVPPAQAVLGPLLRRSAITLLTGPRGVGKSWLALSLAHAAARGRSLAGWRAHKPYRVVYVDAASGEALLQERLAALAPETQPPSLLLVPGDAQAAGLPDVSDAGSREALDRLVADADLVVLDGIAALVQTGRGVGSRWSALAGWLRSLRRRGIAVLLVETSEPRALAALADTVLRLERPVDATAEPGLRCTVRVAASRALADEPDRRFGLHLAFRASGAVWTRHEAVDHRALTAWRLHERDYSSREIAQMLDVSPATAWRLVERGEALPEHLRTCEELPELEEERRWQAAQERAEARRTVRRAKRARELAESAARTDPHPTLSRKRERVPESAGPRSFSGLREKAGDEGRAVAAMPEAKGDAIANSPEAVKQPPASLDAVATDDLLAVFLARRRCYRRNLPPPPDRLAAFAYEDLACTLRSRLTQRVLNTKMLDDDRQGARTPSRAERLCRTAQALLPYDSVA